MGKFNIRKSFNERKLRYGGYSSLLTIIIVAILLVVNLGADQLNMRLDLTRDKLFSLSGQTNELLDGLEREVNIYGMYEPGREDNSIREVLEKYSARSRQVATSFISPNLHPDFVRKYVRDGEPLSIGDIVIESGDKFRVLRRGEIYTYTTNQMTGQSNRHGLILEYKLTNAIAFVTSDIDPVVHVLMGHNETPIPNQLQEYMRDENFVINNLDLIAQEWNPGKDDILLIASPRRDISPEEARKIRDFLGAGGKGFFLIGEPIEQMPNLQEVLAVYGINIPKALVFEDDPSNYIDQRVNLAPNKRTHEIMNPINAARRHVITPVAQYIEELAVKRESLKIEPILVTSNRAYAKVDPQPGTMEKETGDVDGPFNIAVVITDRFDDRDPTNFTRLVVVSNAHFATDVQTAALSNFGNWEMFMNSLNHLVDKAENISIRPKLLEGASITINMNEQLTIAAILVLILPLMILASGITVWLRRRHL
jgi:ABC-2 type transport system permease protein